MQTIEVDDEVFNELKKRVTGFDQSPNDVLREQFQLTREKHVVPSRALKDPELVALLESLERSRATGVSKYLQILSFLVVKSGNRGEKVLGSISGHKRKYFSKNREELERLSGGLQVKLIPRSTFWAMVQIDNNKKGNLLTLALSKLGYGFHEAQLVSRIFRTASRIPALEELLNE